MYDIHNYQKTINLFFFNVYNSRNLSYRSTHEFHVNFIWITGHCKEDNYEKKAWKASGLYGIRTLDLSYTGAAL